MTAVITLEILCNRIKRLISASIFIKGVIFMLDLIVIETN